LAAGILVSRRELPNIEVWRESGGAFPKSFDFAPPIHRKTVAWSVPANAGYSLPMISAISRWRESGGDKFSKSFENLLSQLLNVCCVVPSNAIFPAISRWYR